MNRNFLSIENFEPIKKQLWKFRIQKLIPELCELSCELLF